MCALMAALKRGDTTQIDQQDERGFTALHLAAQQGDYTLVKSLLVAGADPNIKNKNFQADGLDDTTPFVIDSNNNVEFNNNKNSEQINNNQSSNNKKISMENILQDLQDLGSVSALHIAVKFGYIDIAKLLLMYGADPNILDSGHCTPLHWAAVKGFKDTVQLLLDDKADPNIQDLAKSTALHEAVRKNNLSIVRLLLEKNANPNLADVAGDTAYKLASDNQQLLDTIIASSKYLPQGLVCH